MTEQQIRKIVTRYLSLNEYSEQMECLNANDVNSLITELAEASNKRAVNTCTCTHCEPFINAAHGNGCVGYHCKGTCI